MRRTAPQAALEPQMPIRRFDVFTEYNRPRGLRRGMDDAHAKGYGLWVAKVVASGGDQRGAATEAREGEADQAVGQAMPGWHTLDGEAQTGALFDREVVQRMGPAFYSGVFAPAVAQAFAEGKSYETARDSINHDGDYVAACLRPLAWASSE